LSSSPDDPALPTDLAEAKRLIPQMPVSWLATKLMGLDEERIESVIRQAEEIPARQPAAEEP
jgi:hypothetical protein